MLESTHSVIIITQLVANTTNTFNYIKEELCMHKNNICTGGITAIDCHYLTKQQLVPM